MANLEETHEAELDAILGELSLLEQRNINNNNNNNIGGHMNNADVVRLGGRTHSRSNSTISGVTNSTISSTSTSSESGTGSGSDSGGGGGGGQGLREPRTDSPDNDSAFSDTVSLLSSESSASSGISSAHSKNIQLNSNLLQVSNFNTKNVKIIKESVIFKLKSLFLCIFSVIAQKQQKST